MTKIEVSCAYCERKEKFIDTKDITYNKWHIIGWNVATGLAIVLCDKCPAPFWAKKDEEERIQKRTRRTSKTVEKTEREEGDGREDE
jgi:hypothetical protein